MGSRENLPERGAMFDGGHEGGVGVKGFQMVKGRLVLFCLI